MNDMQNNSYNIDH